MWPLYREPEMGFYERTEFGGRAGLAAFRWKPVLASGNPQKKNRAFTIV